MSAQKSDKSTPLGGRPGQESNKSSGVLAAAISLFLDGSIASREFARRQRSNVLGNVPGEKNCAFVFTHHMPEGQVKHRTDFGDLGQACAEIGQKFPNIDRIKIRNLGTDIMGYQPGSPDEVPRQGG